MTYQVNEIFSSLQGEGFWTGVPATFIRLQGCTVGCPWCDSGPLADELFGRQTNGLTRNTWGKGGIKMDTMDIVDQVRDQHVVITGGEPTLYDLDELIIALGHTSYIQLETSGQNPLKGVLRPDWITWSPKKNLGWGGSEIYYREADEVKFVVEPDLTITTIEKLLATAVRLSNKPYVILMPEGSPPKPENVQLARDYARRIVAWGVPNVRYGDRLQYRLGIR